MTTFISNEFTTIADVKITVYTVCKIAGFKCLQVNYFLFSKRNLIRFVIDQID